MLDGIRNATVKAGKVISEPPPATALIALAMAPKTNRMSAWTTVIECQVRFAPAG